jgi:hypothetical protein
MAPSDQNLLDLVLDTDCYRKLDSVEKAKVAKALKGEVASTPRSNIGKVAFYLARRLHPVGSTPPPPDPAASGYAPQAYNKGSSGQDARYNVLINCTRHNDGSYEDKKGVLYDDGGRVKAGGQDRSGQHIDGLKPADQMDNKEPWEPYVHNNIAYPPYPAKSYER